MIRHSWRHGFAVCSNRLNYKQDLLFPLSIRILSHSNAEQDSTGFGLSGQVYVFNMPTLAPAMTSASIVEWHVAENQHVKDEELFVSIIPDRLQELGSDEGKAVLEVEIHEEGVVAMLLEDANPHSSIECGKILALVCESEDDVPKVQALVKEKVDASKFTGREAAWQAYFKAYAQDSCL